MTSLLLLAALALAQDVETRYEPQSGAFTCVVPAGWDAAELDEPSGPVTRLLGPDDPTGHYRAGLSVRWYDPAQEGFLPAKSMLELLRRKEEGGDRSAGAVRVQRIGGVAFRTFEVTETRLLPPDRLPAVSRELHHFVALAPWGQGYFVIRLSSTLETYLDHRGVFNEFLRKFRPR